MRRIEISLAVVSVLLLALPVATQEAPAIPAAAVTEFTLEEATIYSVHAALEAGVLTCSELVEMYLDRVNRFDLDNSDGPAINSILLINPSVRDIAKGLDEAYARDGMVGPLHCVPVWLKANYDTFDHPTSGGSLALLGSQAPDDAHTVAKLRAAGAVIMGKTSTVELGAGSDGRSGRSGIDRNPYDARHSAGGSSSGAASAPAANFGLIGLGVDDCSSIIIPSTYTSLVGIRTTVGLVSRDGLIAPSLSDTAPGPMGRTVRDVAIALDVMAGVDVEDRATLDPEAIRPPTYTAFLREDGVAGKRIGVLHSYGVLSAPLTDEAPDNVKAIWDQVIVDLRSLGAEIVEPVTLPRFQNRRYSVPEYMEAWRRYLLTTSNSPSTLQELVETDRLRPDIEQGYRTRLVNPGLASIDNPEYWAYVERLQQNWRYIKQVMDVLDLDAWVFPSNRKGSAASGRPRSNCNFSTLSQTPQITVPAGFDEAPDIPMPVGASFAARRWDEATLFEIAYAYEQFTQHRRPPALVSAIPEDEALAPLDIERFNALKTAIGEEAFLKMKEKGGSLSIGEFTEIVREVKRKFGAR